MRALITLVTLTALAGCTGAPAGAPDAPLADAALADAALADAGPAPDDAGRPDADPPDAGWAPVHGPWVGEHPFRALLPERFARVAALPGGELVVAVEEGRLAVIDAGAPGGPAVVGELSLGGHLNDVVVSPVGPTAYVAGTDVRVVDLADPRRPQLAGALRTTSGVTRLAITPAGDTLIGVTREGLVVADLAEPRHPAQVALLPAPRYYATDLAAGDGVALATGPTTVQVIDLAARMVVAEVDATPSAVAVSPDGATGFVGSGAGVLLLDLRQPAAPEPLGEWPGGDGAGAIAVAPDGRTLALTALQGLWILDVADPTAPVLRARHQLGAYARAAAFLAADRAVVATMAGVEPVDLRAPGFPPLAHHTRVPAWHETADVRLAADGATAFLAGPGLAVVDLTDPPHATAHDEAARDLHGLTLSDDGATLYAAGEGGLLVLDVRRPAEPALIGALDLGGYPRPVGVAVDGETAYLGTEGAGGLRVVDLSTPAEPIPGAAFYSRHLESILLSADHQTVFLGDRYEGGLVAVDVRDPASPMFQGRLARAVHEMARSPDGALIAATGDADLLLIDVRDPASPVLLGSLPLTGVPGDVAFTPDGACVLVADGQLRRIDVRDPTAPRLQATYALPGDLQQLALRPDGRMVVGAAGPDVSLLALAPLPTLTADAPPVDGVTRLTLRWPERPGPVRLAWRGPGEVRLVEIDQAAREATLAWTPPVGEASELLVALGTPHFFEVAAAHAESN